MVSLYVQGPVTEENIINVLDIIRSSESIIVECYWVYVGSPEFENFNAQNIKFISVVDPGSIDVAVPPHYANTNRMIATTKKMVELDFSSEYILKIRSDISLSDKKSFKGWLESVIHDGYEISVVARENHNWSLPFNIGDWIFFGRSENLKKLTSKLTFVATDSGRGGKLSISRLLFGYCKSGFSPEYTTEQVFGGMLFDCKMPLNSIEGFYKWVRIKNNRIRKYAINVTGLECKKHNHYVGKSFELVYIVTYAPYNFLRNIVRLVFISRI